MKITTGLEVVKEKINKNVISVLDIYYIDNAIEYIELLESKLDKIDKYSWCIEKLEKIKKEN